MRTISLINQKGGCGKTTCSINLAACLAYLGQRTLLVDMDPQGHCAVGLAVPDAQIEKSVYDILRVPSGTTSVTLKDITWQIAANFDLAPSNITLAALETELHGIPGRQDRLSDALSRVASEYDFCIVDCPPNVGLLTFNAMRASSDVIIPVETGYFSLHGLTKQLELLEQLGKQCHQELRIRILATLYDIRTKLAREVLAELREQFIHLLMEATINFNTKLKEAASFGQPITEYDPASKGFKDFHKLARELMGPQPRMTLNLTPAQPRAIPAEESAETLVATARETVEQTLETLQEGIELSEPVDMVPGMRRSQRVVSQDLKAQADLLTRRADEVLMAAQRSMGIAIASRTTAVSAAATQQKIEEFYGVRQVPEGLLFVAHFPNAQNVSIAGDFNNWTPDRMSADAEAQDTFRSLMALKPGRYRYRLVVDGRWQSDPHNVYAEPNPFGELDSIVEVV
jgi:chromosome partitioning protein